MEKKQNWVIQIFHCLDKTDDISEYTPEDVDLRFDTKLWVEHTTT